MTELIDAFGRKHTYLRLSVTDRCNLRCVYCMPPEGIEHKECAQMLSFDEIVHLVRIFAGMGISKVRLTGGEPLLRRNLERLIADLADIPGIETVGLTTNGVLLAEHAGSLKRAGLDLLNVSLDTLRSERFEDITLRNLYQRVRDGLGNALETGFNPLKLNVVVVKGVNDDELLDFVEFVKDKPVKVRFIEYMPFRANCWRMDRFVSFARMRSAIETKYKLLPVADQADHSIVAREFRIDGFQGTVGFITSLSDHFCHHCNRLRLTADGCLKLCLYHQAELDLRGALRSGNSDEVLAEMVCRALAGKPLKHSSLNFPAAGESRTMIEIGG